MHSATVAAAPRVTIVSDVVSMSRVTVRRGAAVLLDTVQWQVAAGERWVVIGPNGAGKTTLIHIAAGISHPTTGSVQLLGEPLGLTDLSELRLRIGVSTAWQAEAIPPGERVLDVVMTASWAVSGRWRERYAEDDERRAGELLAQVGCERLRERTFATLSEGERKRVQIARALMVDPELLILDEPMAALDLGAREQVVATIGTMARDPRGPALVLVTHHLEEIPPGFTHALVLAGGRVVAAGPIDATLTTESLAAAYGLVLDVRTERGRWTAVAAGR